MATPVRGGLLCFVCAAADRRRKQKKPRDGGFFLETMPWWRPLVGQVPMAEWGHAARAALVKTSRTDAMALSKIREASGPPSSIRSLVK